MNPADTIVAISSPPGPAVRGIVRVSGPDANAVATALLGELPAPRRATVASLRLPAWPAVDALVLRFAAPHSYTGDDLIEWHLPGSRPLLEALVAAILALTATGDAEPDRNPLHVRPAGPGEFTMRAVLNGRLDVPRAEAVGALIAAREPAAALAHAATLVGGSGDDPVGLAARVSDWRERLQQMLGRCELALDFSDDEDLIYVADPPRLTQEVAELHAELVAVAARIGATTADADLPDVVLAGPANAGKSSLFNALLGDRRAIVTRHAGTTRDALSAELQAPAIRLWDTAGLREPGASASDVDTWAEDAARGLAGNCALLVWCWPAHIAPLVVPDELAPGLIVQTHADRPAAWQRTDALPVSSTDGRGIGELRDAIRTRAAATDESAAFGSARQAAHLQSAAEALQRAVPLAADGSTLELASLELGEADRELASLLALDPATGVASEAILYRIFGTFCVGK